MLLEQFFETRYVVGDLVCRSADPLGVDAKRQVDQEQAEEECKTVTNFITPACACGPAESQRIVGDVEEDWVWIVCEVGGSYHMEGGNIVDDNSDELKDVDGDECSVIVVGFE